MSAYLTRTAKTAVLLLAGGVGVARADEAAKPFDELRALAKAYKVEFVTEPRFPVKTSHGKIDGKAADEKKLAKYVALFVPEFSLYPADLVKRAQLKRVVFCESLSFAGQLRNAIPDYEHFTLYLDVGRAATNKPYLRAVIHHEFFHIVDYLDDGEVYRDKTWSALNPPKFVYGKGGRFAQDVKKTSALTDEYPGFLNHYSTTGVEEDKAEMFAHMVLNADHVEGRAKKDAVIEKKVARMKALLVEFCPSVYDDFWAKARKLKRADD